MWGHLCTELSTLNNFNVSFSTHKSEVLIHLSQWQYWWWFWFSFFWTFYFFVILRSIKHRVFKMNIRINTSLRSRGKWGDYLVTLIPLSWCLNILLNSNFILRMIEWQSESGALIVRIHGKQWYWIYKYDLSNMVSLMETPKNIGNNKWITQTKSSNNVSDIYYQKISLKIKNQAQADYWKDVNLKEFNPTSTFKSSFGGFKQNKIKLNTDNMGIKTTNLDNSSFSKKKNLLDNSSNVATRKEIFIIKIKNTLVNNEVNVGLLHTYVKNKLNNNKYLFSVNSDFFYKTSPMSEVLISVDSGLVVTDMQPSSFKNINLVKVESNVKTNKLFFYENAGIDDEWEVYSNIKTNDSETPVKIVPEILNQLFLSQQGLNFKNLINVKFSDSSGLIVEKPEENIDFLVVKQKRYKRKQNINRYSVNSQNLTSFDELTINKSINNNKQTSRFLKNNLIFKQILNLNSQDPYKFYSSIKLNRNRAESFSINMTKRLLRVTRVLVLPAYTNISLIANSYDVVHSWFIPGLGIKIDCVPGKSTHHSLYIDNVGLYYGQCAEICGRYHHHMPIQICALPFEHFLIWWTSKGLPKLTKINFSNNKKLDDLLLTKYRW